MDNFLFALTAFETRAAAFALVSAAAVISLVYLWHAITEEVPVQQNYSYQRIVLLWTVVAYGDGRWIVYSLACRG